MLHEQTIDELQSLKSEHRVPSEDKVQFKNRLFFTWKVCLLQNASIEFNNLEKGYQKDTNNNKSIKVH